MAYFDPNILLKGGQFNPASNYLEGERMGLASQLNQQAIAQNDAQMQEQEGLMGLAQHYGTDQLIPEAMSVSPSITKSLVEQQIAQQLKKSRGYQPDNEWVDDPDNESYEVYMQVKQSPDGQPVSSPVPGMKRKKSYLDRLDQKKKEHEHKVEQDIFGREMKLKEFSFDLIMGNAKRMKDVEDIKEKKLKRLLDESKYDYTLQKETADIEENYETVKLDINDGLDTIDRMIGNKSKGIPVHPGFKDMVGRKGSALGFGLKDLPLEATDARSFFTLHEKLKGKAFLMAFQSLKGGGPITDVEGQKAEKALSEMDTATDEKTYIAATRRFEKHMRKLLELNEQIRKRKTPSAKARGFGEPKQVIESDEDLLKGYGIE